MNFISYQHIFISVCHISSFVCHMSLCSNERTNLFHFIIIVSSMLFFIRRINSCFNGNSLVLEDSYFYRLITNDRALCLIWPSDASDKVT